MALKGTQLFGLSLKADLTSSFQRLQDGVDPVEVLTRQKEVAEAKAWAQRARFAEEVARNECLEATIAAASLFTQRALIEQQRQAQQAVAVRLAAAAQGARIKAEQAERWARELEKEVKKMHVPVRPEEDIAHRRALKARWRPEWMDRADKERQAKPVWPGASGVEVASLSPRARERLSAHQMEELRSGRHEWLNALPGGQEIAAKPHTPVKDVDRTILPPRDSTPRSTGIVDPEALMNASTGSVFRAARELRQASKWSASSTPKAPIKGIHNISSLSARSHSQSKKSFLSMEDTRRLSAAQAGRWRIRTPRTEAKMDRTRAWWPRKDGGGGYVAATGSAEMQRSW